jgi:ferrochelatase
VKRFAPRARLEEIRSWPDHPLLVQAHADLIRGEVARFRDPSPERIHLLFSAHSIPEKLVTRLGDPYPREVERTVAAVLAALKWDGPSSLAWQSKLGPVKWLEPSTLQTIERLGRDGAAQVLAVPISFVSDHIETLNEMDILFREAAERAGIGEFRRTRGLNDHPTFLAALADLAGRRAAARTR